MKFQENVGHDGWIYCFFIVFFQVEWLELKLTFYYLRRLGST